jgi:arylformamidase
VDVVAVPDEPAVRPEHVTDVTAERVLFKTSAGALSDDKWPDSITPIDAETTRALSSQGVVLVGTDAPSVDPLDSTALPAHHALLDADVVNLEGLRLGHVPAGRYYLMAFPLKLSAADAAPVRAVLADAAPE